jgi:hypothetical protein
MPVYVAAFLLSKTNTPAIHFELQKGKRRWVGAQMDGKPIVGLDPHRLSPIRAALFIRRVSVYLPEEIGICFYCSSNTPLRLCLESVHKGIESLFYGV